MKKIFALCVTLTMILGLSSCGDDSVLSASSAKKALKKEAIFAKDSAVEKFNTGYYEVDEATLTSLKQLKAAGMITLTTETIIEKVSKRNYDFWRGYYYYTVDKEHTFANVQLTEEGKKFEVAEPTKLRSDIIKDFKANEDYTETVPDYMGNYESTPATAIEEAVEEVVVADSVAVEETVVEEVAEVVTEPEPATQPDKADPNAAYNAATAKVTKEEHYMLLGKYELVKVKEILCTEEMAKNGRGQCLVLFTFRDKTPFGYVFGAPRQDYINSTKVNFIHYQDLGWTVIDSDN